MRKSVQKIDSTGNASLRSSPSITTATMSEIPTVTSGNAVLRMPYTASLQLPISSSPPSLPSTSSSRIVNTSRLLEPTLDWHASVRPHQMTGERTTITTTTTTTATTEKNPHSSNPTFTPRGVVMDAALGGLSPLSARILSRIDLHPLPPLPVESREKEEEKRHILPFEAQPIFVPQSIEDTSVKSIRHSSSSSSSSSSSKFSSSLSAPSSSPSSSPCSFLSAS